MDRTPEAYHIPGYSGHLPKAREMYGMPQSFITKEAVRQLDNDNPQMVNKVLLSKIVSPTQVSLSARVRENMAKQHLGQSALNVDSPLDSARSISSAVATPKDHSSPLSTARSSMRSTSSSIYVGESVNGMRDTGIQTHQYDPSTNRSAKNAPAAPLCTPEWDTFEQADAVKKINLYNPHRKTFSDPNTNTTSVASPGSHNARSASRVGAASPWDHRSSEYQSLHAAETGDFGRTKRTAVSRRVMDYFHPSPNSYGGR